MKSWNANFSRLNIPPAERESIIHELSKEDLLTVYSEGVLRSDKTRKTFYEQHFDYIEPTQMYLGIDAAGKKRFCQYISIKETLKSSLDSPVLETNITNLKIIPRLTWSSKM